MPLSGCGLVPRFRVRVRPDRKSTRLNSSHLVISYAVFCSEENSHMARSLQLEPYQAYHLRWQAPQNNAPDEKGVIKARVLRSTIFPSVVRHTIGVFIGHK